MLKGFKNVILIQYILIFYTLSMVKLSIATDDDLIEKWLLLIVRVGIFAVLITPLIVLRNAYFPYIVPKTIYFRIVVDLILLVYLWLCCRNQFWLPKKSWLSASLVFYYAVLILATVFSLNPIRSFWSTWERMDGTFTLLHIFALVIVMANVFIDDKWWRRFFVWQIVLAFLMYGYSLAQRVGASFTFESGATRVSGTLGNPAYVAAYALFYFFISLWLFWGTKKHWWRWLYLGMSFLSLLVLFLTQTRGAQLGLLVTFLFIAVTLFFLDGYKSKGLRTLAVIGLLAIVLWVLAVVYKESPFIKNNDYIYRIASVSLQENTIQTRLFSWKGGLKEFPNYWLTGVGPENYQIIFNKEFDPKFLNFSPGEVWFDRAHNMVVEMALTRGLFGLLSYLALFVVAIWLLWRLYRKNSIDKISFILLTSVFISYFLQNLAVFDALATYLLFFLLLAYVYYLENKEAGLTSFNYVGFSGTKKYVLYGGVTILIILSIWSFVQNFRQINGNSKIIQAFIDSNQNYQTTVDNYYQAIKLGEPITETRVLLLNYLISVSGQLQANSGIDPKFKQQVQTDYKMALREMEKSSVSENSNLFFFFVLGRGYITYMDTFGDGSVMPRALEVAQRGVELSPKNLRAWYLLAELDMMQKKSDQAIEIFKKVADWNLDYLEPTWTLATVYFQTNHFDQALSSVDYLLDHGYVWTNQDQLAQLTSYYEQKQDLPRLVIIYKQLIQKQPEKKDWLPKLAAVYLKMGKQEEAKNLLGPIK